MSRFGDEFRCFEKKKKKHRIHLKIASKKKRMEHLVDFIVESAYTCHLENTPGVMESVTRITPIDCIVPSHDSLELNTHPNLQCMLHDLSATREAMITYLTKKIGARDAKALMEKVVLSEMFSFIVNIDKLAVHCKPPMILTDRLILKEVVTKGCEHYFHTNHLTVPRTDHYFTGFIICMCVLAALILYYSTVKNCNNKKKGLGEYESNKG